MAKQKSKSDILKKRAKQNKGSFITNIFLWFVGLIVLIILLSSIAIGGIYFYLSKDLPKISSLTDYRPPIITTVYSDDNRKIAEFYKERRIILSLSEMPKVLIDAFIAAEDARFFKHKGIDFLSIIRAYFKNIEAGAIVQGGSTITQQVTKSFLLTPEKNYTRKIKEVILAYRIDKKFTKEEILFLYLNQIYLGHGAYGVEAASENYFGKSAKDLNLAECAILAGLPQAPSRYSPFRNPEKAKQRQIYVLNRMIAEGYITNIQATEAINTKLDIKPRCNWYIEKVPFYTEHIRRYIEKKYGPDALYNDGLKIYTAVNIEMQKAAMKEIEKGLKALDKRQGYRGPLKHLAEEEIEAFSKELQEDFEKNPIEEGKIVNGVVIEVNDTNDTAIIRIGNAQGIININSMRWARKPDPEVPYYETRVEHPREVLDIGDVILVKLKNKITDSDLWELELEQEPNTQAALLSIEAETGHVKVMLGGRDFRESQFNRAIQSKRQPGSAFKPIIYAAAIDKGYTPASVIIDSSIVFEDTEHNFTWKPKNYEEKFHGPTLLRDAIAKSRNVVTIKILKDIGIDYVIDYARKLGITSNLSRDLSIALGSSGMSLLEIVTAYSVFANLGYFIEPVFITKIIDRNGNVLEEANIKRKKVIDQSTAYIITSLLEGVVKYGTGRRVQELNRPVAGKTGTTNNLHDAWFVGFTPRYITGTWVGFDDESSLGKGETGSKAASPIWLGFMKYVLADKPVKVFHIPEGVVFSKIDAETGLLPIPESKKTIFECFKEGTIPTEYTKKPDSINEPENFFKSGM
ncbi:MAG: PBP1A family penicillin-binding protein [Desulfobacteraceae bacterium]|nr:PBP1A family penicillin-binding protein [Pseudomonadota bacterium]MCG2758067.1 PBP1A family penicillin-binding protein [Desulfobacteraceae bacterium]